MFLERVIGVFKLDAQTFEAIEHDPASTVQAAIIVAIVSVLSAVGSAFGAAIGDGSIFGSFASTLVWSFIGWFLWSAVTYFVGTNLFKGRSTIEQMMRVIGFAYAPQMLGIIPWIGGIVGWIWSVIAGFIAVRQGLNLDDSKACLTILFGFILYVLGSGILQRTIGGSFWFF